VIWDTDTGKKLATCSGHADDVVSWPCMLVAWLPRDKDKTVKSGNTSTGTLLHTLSGHSAEVTQVVYSPMARG